LDGLADPHSRIPYSQDELPIYLLKSYSLRIIQILRWVLGGAVWG